MSKHNGLFIAITVIALIVQTNNANGQDLNSSVTQDSIRVKINNYGSNTGLALPQVNIGGSVTHPWNFQKFAIPVGLISYGVFAMNNRTLLHVDNYIKEEIWTEDSHHRMPFDNYLQYGIGFSVFGLHAMGLQGKNNFRDETMLYLLSNAIMGAIVNPVKRITRIQRPDGSGHNAFPSGHTATAFVGAEFLNQEYKDVSPWYGIAGYSMATLVGYMRIYNNKHWMRDVITGAGIGMASTKLAYIIYPGLSHWLFKGKNQNLAIMPGYENRSAVVNLSLRF